MSFQFSKWTVLPAAVLLLGTVAAAQDTNTPSAPAQGTTTTAPAQKPTIAQRTMRAVRVLMIPRAYTKSRIIATSGSSAGGIWYWSIFAGRTQASFCPSRGMTIPCQRRHT